MTVNRNISGRVTGNIYFVHKAVGLYYPSNIPQHSFYLKNQVKKWTPFPPSGTCTVTELPGQMKGRVTFSAEEPKDGL